MLITLAVLDRTFQSEFDEKNRLTQFVKYCRRELPSRARKELEKEIAKNHSRRLDIGLQDQIEATIRRCYDQLCLLFQERQIRDGVPPSPDDSGINDAVLDKNSSAAAGPSARREQITELPLVMPSLEFGNLQLDFQEVVADENQYVLNDEEHANNALFLNLNSTTLPAYVSYDGQGAALDYQQLGTAALSDPNNPPEIGNFGEHDQRYYHPGVSPILEPMGSDEPGSAAGINSQLSNPDTLADENYNYDWLRQSESE